MKLIKSLICLFCATLTVVANEEQTAEEFLDQYLNSKNLSQEHIDLIIDSINDVSLQEFWASSRGREAIISVLEAIISLIEQAQNSPATEIRINENALALFDTKYSGDWMWFGAFPWVYSSKYESWLYLYSNLDVSIYGENGYTRKDSNYSTKMKWVWVVREDDSFLSYWNDPQQSRFAYSNDEKAWLHFKQSNGNELYSYSAVARRWGVFGKEIFEWINIYVSADPSARKLIIRNLEMQGRSILSLSNPIYSLEYEAKQRREPAKSAGADNNGSATLGALAEQEGKISPTDENSLVALDAINAAGGIFADKTSDESGISNPNSGN